MAAFHLGQTKSVMRITFDKFDATGDGMLDKNEFAQFCYSMGHYMEGQAFEEHAMPRVHEYLAAGAV